MKRDKIMGLTKICICIFFVLQMGKVSSQNLRVTESRYITLIQNLMIKYPGDIQLSTSINEYDTDKLKKFFEENNEKLTREERVMFEDLLRQYDHKRVRAKNNEQPIEYKNGEFHAYKDEEPQYQFDSTMVYDTKDPLLKYFYKTQNHFLKIDRAGLNLRANPIVQFSLGKATNYEKDIFKNTRGAELTGYIDKKIYLYTKILETQEGMLPQVESYIQENKAIPGNGLYKIYQSSVLKKVNGYDFLNAQAHVGFPISKSIGIELGHGKHFIGNGYRSLLLSNFGNNYFYLKFNTNVWKLHYQNIFAELAAESNASIGNDQLLSKKYMANHYLSIRPHKRIEFGIFETVVFARKDHFEFQYLNPLILYRVAEHLLGSPDNILIGLNANYIVGKKTMVYSQLLIDEFLLELITSDWIGNKYAYQVGVKTTDLFLKNLDLRVEYNSARPYTYTHNRPFESRLSHSNYSHYNQALAHPLGANFREFICNLSYQPNSKLMIDVILAKMDVGRNTETNKNVGNNILQNTNKETTEYGNKILQGDKNSIYFAKCNLSYEVVKNYKLFLNPTWRKAKATQDKYQSSYLYLGGGISINLDFEKTAY